MSRRLLIRRDDGTLQTVSLNATVRIGSAPDNDLALSHPQVSPQHARIGVTDGEPWVEDAGSQSGTSVNGEPVKRRALRHLDIVTLGRAVNVVYLQSDAAPHTGLPPSEPAGTGTMLFGGDHVVPADVLRAGQARETLVQRTVFDPQAAQGPPGAVGAFDTQAEPSPVSIVAFHEVSPAPKVSPEPPPRDLDMTRLPDPPAAPPPARPRAAAASSIVGVRLTGPSGVYEPMLGRTVVGRGTTAGVRIKSKEMSRSHAIIVVTPTEVTVEDQQSANGTTVNGEPAVGARHLVDGDRVSFATFEFRVEILRLPGNRQPAAGNRHPE